MTFQDFVKDALVNNILNQSKIINRVGSYFRASRNSMPNNGLFPARSNAPRISIGPHLKGDNKVFDNARLQKYWEDFRKGFAHIDLRFRPLDTLKNEARWLNKSQRNAYLRHLEKTGKKDLANKMRGVFDKIPAAPNRRRR